MKQSLQRFVLIVSTLFTLALVGCANPPQLFEVKSIYICAGEECGPAGQRASTEQMLRGLQRLFEENDGLEYKVCMSDIKTRNCQAEGLGYFVMGGPIPGKGSQTAGKFSKPKLDTVKQELAYANHPNLFFNGIPLVCVSHPGKVTVRSSDEITLVDDGYYCNWAGVGNMVATFNFAVESIDFDRGRIGGYWSHGVAGLGAGKGQGYGVISLSKGIPRNVNWLDK